MAKNIPFVFEGTTFEAPVNKIDRVKLYGKTEKRYSDGKQTISSEEELSKREHDYMRVSLLDDNKTMYGSGGAALKYVDDNGDEVSRSTFIARNEDGTEAVKIPSSFDEVNELSTEKGLTEYLSMDVKSVYQLDMLEDKDKVMEMLKAPKVLYFKFNYRAGYSCDDAFLISQTSKDKKTGEVTETIFAIVGKINDYEYCTYKNPVKVEEVAEEEEEEDDDFGFDF